MPKRLVMGANWKMHFTLPEASHYIAQLREHAGEFDRGLVRAYILPAFTELQGVSEAMGAYPVEVGSQNVHWEDAGAYTGEVSPPMVKAVGCTIAMLGHSERRALFGETDEVVSRKIRAVFRHGLNPLVCIGETSEDRNANRTEDVLREQVNTVLRGVTPDLARDTLLLYEPRWAIGAAKPASLKYIESVHGTIRTALAEKYDDETAEQVSLVYGGSVTLSNLVSILRLPTVDGCGVGRASLDPVNFAAMIRLTEETAREIEREKTALSAGSDG